MLEIRNLDAWYGESHVLHGVELDVHASEVVTLPGRSRAGSPRRAEKIDNFPPLKGGLLRL